MYADDLVLLSKSEQGLQNCLSKLKSYCTNWNLTVNIDKTKVMIFSKPAPSKMPPKFMFGDIPLDYASEYCYLGIVFTSNGLFDKVIDSLQEKASKAFNKIKSFDLRSKPILAFKLLSELVLCVMVM